METKNMFTLGDCVILKSGGVKMTVHGIIGLEGLTSQEESAYRNQQYPDGEVVCLWFDKQGLKTAIFHPQELEKA